MEFGSLFYDSVEKYKRARLCFWHTMPVRYSRSEDQDRDFSTTARKPTIPLPPERLLSKHIMETYPCLLLRYPQT